MVPEVYARLAMNPGRISDTTLLMLERVYKIEPPPDGGKALKFRFYGMIIKDSNINAEVRKQAQQYRSHFSPSSI